MNMTSYLFFFFAAVLLVAGFKVITARNTVHSALYLVLTFVNAAFIWMLLHAEFLAIVLVLVYVGAVMVLFLFVVMMLDVDRETVRERFWASFPLAGFIGVLIALEMAVVMKGGFNLHVAKPLPDNVLAMGNSRALGMLLYSEYIYPLQVAGMLLLVAMVAAVALTLRGRKDARSQSPAEQVRVKAADRVRMVQMAPVVEVPPTPAEAPAPEAGKGDKA